MLAKGGASNWNRVHEAITWPSADGWHGRIATAVQRAASVRFASVITCPPGYWHALESATYPSDHHGIIARVRRQFLRRIDEAGEGWRQDLKRHGCVYAPLDTTQDPRLGEEFRRAVLAPFSLEGYVASFCLNAQDQLVGLVVVGDEAPSSQILEAHLTNLRDVVCHLGQTLTWAHQLARSCGASFLRFDPAVFGLTPREREVASLAAEGYSSLNISARLEISVDTVNVHLRRAYRKLGVHNRAELARKMFGASSENS